MVARTSFPAPGNKYVAGNICNRRNLVYEIMCLTGKNKMMFGLEGLVSNRVIFMSNPTSVDVEFLLWLSWGCYSKHKL